MLKNYITTALRTLLKNKLYSAINIGGLAVGLAACVLILLFVRDELGYDTWLADAERLYKLETTFYIPGRDPMSFTEVPGPASDALAKDFPSEIEQTARLYRTGETISRGETEFNQTVSYVDANFFEIFDLPIVSGDRQLAMESNSAILLSEEMARKFFGDEDPLGQILTLSNKIDYTVAGVFRDIPRNSHLDIDLIGLFDVERYKDRSWVTEMWLSANVHIYLKLAPGADPRALETSFPEFLKRNVEIKAPGFEMLAPGDVMKFNLIAVPDIHLYGDKAGYPKQGGDIVAVITFSSVAGLILLIASINFMNLATARSMQRAREVSIRKVVGATRRQLVGQFLGEAILTTLFGLFLAVAMVELALPWYNEFLQKELVLDMLGDPAQSAAVLALAIFVGVIGGLYPAFVLSGFRPARVLKANQSSAEGTATLRNALVVVQFSISIALLVATGIVYGQTIYARNMNLGFEKEHKLVLRGMRRDASKDQAGAIKQEMLNIPGVVDAAFASDMIPQNSERNTVVKIPGASGEPPVIERMDVGLNFFKLYGVTPVAGRLFSDEFRGDIRNVPENQTVDGSQGAVVNMDFLGKAGWSSPEAAIDKIVSIPVGFNDQNIAVTIVGVVPDMHLRSIRFPITPMLFLARDGENLNVMTLDLLTDDLPRTLAAIDRTWQAMVPDEPIIRSFIDETFDALYNAEEERGRMFAGFALFAVLVACLGLYGLASFAAEKRTKEIGIRKVMGASVTDIVRLLVWQFSKPVLLANLIAWPVAWYFMADWLTNFQYRIDLVSHAYLFLVAGAIALAIAWATVSGHATRVARANPIRALRYE